MADHAEATNATATYQQGLDLVKSALEDIKKRLSEFDTNFSGVSEKASTYMNAGIEKAHAAVGELAKLTESLKSGPTEVPVRALSNALASVHAAFNQITEQAQQYDEKMKLSTRLSTVVAHPREQATAALATIATYAAHASSSAQAQLQGVSDALRARLAETATAGLDKALPQAVKADEIFHVSERAAATRALIAQTAKDLDEKFGLSGYLQTAAGAAQNLDAKYAGGRITPALTGAYNKGWAMIGAVQEMYEDKKREMKTAGP